MTKDAISLHRKLGGKIFVGSKITPLKLDDIELIYTPGVAKVCQHILKKKLSENHIIPILGDKKLQKRMTASLTKLLE